MIRGLIYSLSIILALFLVADIIEYFAWTSVLARTIIFFSFVASALLVFVFYVIIPGFQLIRSGKVIAGQQATKIIGDHFPEVSDKLINCNGLPRLFPAPNTTP